MKTHKTHEKRKDETLRKEHVRRDYYIPVNVELLVLADCLKM